MNAFSFFRSIRARLAALIILAMTALVGLLIYQQIEARNEDKRRGDENLQRLATFAAHAERERFEAAGRLLTLAATSGATLRTAAANPDSTEAYDRCTSGLFVLDQLLPETSGFALWDTSGSVLCSSEAAKRGEFSVADRLWFQTAREREHLATGAYELSPPNAEPSLGFGLPIKDPASGEIVAYLSTGLSLSSTDSLLAGTNLPKSGRLSIVDQNGIIINSSDGRSGEPTTRFVALFGSLDGFLDARVTDGTPGRRVAGVRITDADDTAVVVVVGADQNALAAPLSETLFRDLVPVVVVTLLTLLALWMLAHYWIMRPVAALVLASDRLAAGDLSARARVPSGISEFEALGASFNDMAATRERATEAKDEFLGLVSHELRTPITTVLGNAEILSKRADVLDREMRQTAYDDIHDGAQRLVSIVDNLLALARLERGAGLDSEPLALQRMAQTITDDQLRRAPGRRVLVRGDATVLALGGPTQVEQILRNLIGNAIKYSPSGAVIEVVVERDGDNALVRVLDRGGGIDESEYEAVFQPFYRSERTSASAEGIGIGLSVCKRLVEAMGGEIWCAARAGGGSEFSFRLPLDPDGGPQTIEDERLIATA